MNSSDNNSFLGIEIGGTKLQLVQASAQGTILKRERFAIIPSEGAEGIKSQIGQGLRKFPLENIAAIGAGFGGPVNWKTGLISVSHQVSGWNQFSLKDWLQNQTARPVRVDNDANVAALAEAVYGSGKGFSNVFYMTIGSGIGGGLVVKGQIYHGRVPGEIEIGHVRLDKLGTTLESQCSGWAVNEKIQEIIISNPQSLLAQAAKSHTGPLAALLKPALERNDKLAEAIISEISDNIAFALSHVVHLIHPDVIVIGGGLSLIGEPLIGRINELLPGYLMEALLPAPSVKSASLGEDVVPLGAIELAKQGQYD